MKLHIIMPVVALMALGVVSPALAQTSPQPAAQPTMIQDQGAQTTSAKPMKAKNQKMAKKAEPVKAKHAKAKPAASAPADEEAMATDEGGRGSARS